MLNSTICNYRLRSPFCTGICILRCFSSKNEGFFVSSLFPSIKLYWSPFLTRSTQIQSSGIFGVPWWLVSGLQCEGICCILERGKRYDDRDPLDENPPWFLSLSYTWNISPSDLVFPWLFSIKGKVESDGRNDSKILNWLGWKKRYLSEVPVTIISRFKLQIV